MRIEGTNRALILRLAAMGSPRAFGDGRSCDCLGWRTQALTNRGILGLAGLGDLGTGLDEEFRGWPEWRMPVMLLVLEQQGQELPGMGGVAVWLVWRKTALVGMGVHSLGTSQDERSRDCP